MPQFTRPVSELHRASLAVGITSSFPFGHARRGIMLARLWPIIRDEEGKLNPELVQLYRGANEANYTFDWSIICG